MMVRLAERLPGGRWLILLIPLVLFVVGSLAFPAAVVTQVANSVILVLAVWMLYTYRGSIPTFFRERKEAGMAWISLGSFTLILTTVFNTGHSALYRMMEWPLNPDSRFVSATRFLYALSFGCLALVPLARGAEVPPTGWGSLAAVVVLTSAFTLLMIWFF